MSRANLELIFSQATEADRATGLDSWFHYNRLLTTIGKRTGFGIQATTGVFAALSPNNDYMGNLRDTVRLLKAKHDKLKVHQFSVSTFNQNKEKAWAIAEGDDPLYHLRAPKTRNFYNSIVDPNDRRWVTVDGHIFNIYAGKRVALTDVKTLGGDYDVVADEIRSMGDAHGLIPNQIQGILWYVWKRIHRIRWDAQLELLPGDVLVAQNYRPKVKVPQVNDRQGELLDMNETLELFV